jgi:signal transduction histidine kinase/ligand-binding sensor domain-containing protein
MNPGTGARRVAATQPVIVAFAAGLLLGFSVLPAYSQQQTHRYVASVWGTEQGLPQSSVNTILQDHAGYLWVGTFGGLARFDGERFTVFDPASTPNFGGARILDIFESRSGVLWLATTEGLIRLENGVATTFTERDGLPSAFIRSVREDSEGQLWINTAGGAARFTGKRIEPYRAHRGIPVNEFFLEARDGSMWFRSGRDVVRFGKDGSTASVVPGRQSTFLVREARDGVVWVAFRDEPRLVRYDRGAFSDVQLPRVERAELMGEYKVSAITFEKDVDGSLLLLTPAGLIRIADGRLSAPESLPLPRSDSELPKVRSFRVDREGNLWIGTVGSGLVRLRQTALTAYGKEEGLSDESFNAIFQDRDGVLWLGGDSLYSFDGRQFQRVPGISNVLAITQTRSGDLWFGGYGALYRSRSGVVTRFKVDAPGVKAIYEDRDGTLWIGALKQERAGGLYRFDDGRLTLVPAISDGISDVSQIIRDRDDGFWVTGVDALFLIRGGRAVRYGREQGLPEHSDDLRQDSTGTLWLASYGTGLARMRGGRFKTITTRNGLPNNMLVGILNDGNGNLWVSSNQNIFRLSLRELNDVADGKVPSVLPVSYGLGEGMRSSESNHGSPAAWQTTDGRIWFPTLHGVVAIDRTFSKGVPPPVIIEEASASNFPIPVDGHAYVPPGDNTFDFRFTALNFTAPEKVRFKYKLEPFDKDWVDGGTVRTAHYTNMAPGNYSFRVIAANSYGVWNDRGASLSFILRPRFYQTSWFDLICAVALVALLWAGYWQRLRKIRHDFGLRLEGQLDERMRLARELHDTLLQSFQGLIPVFQAARNLLPRRADQAAEILDEGLKDAAQAIVEGREAIQNLRANTTADGDLSALLTAAGEDLARIQEAEGSTPEFTLIIEGPKRPLSPLLQDEVYRIGREMLRNSFQHAHAERIEVELRYGDDIFRLRVRDDGKGIDPGVLQDGARAGHWGVTGMRERAERMGGKFTIWSESGAGTEAEVTVPARVAYSKLSKSTTG